jgi:death-on-curing protein
VKEPIWIELRETLVIHERLLMIHGGAPGLRDRNLLEAALARPTQHFACADSADILSLGAIYTAIIIQHYPFVDGNNRTGFLIGVLFLEVNGYRFRATQEDATRAVFELAAGIASESDYVRFLRANSIRLEIE